MAPDDASGPDAARHDVIVIGASAGGVQVLLELAAGLPRGFPACVLVVLHVGTHRSLLPELMRARGVLPAAHARDGQALQPGHIFVAPPDHHLLVEDGHLRLYRGPKENHARPAIDPLFRSAALELGPRVIGVILSGGMDDGTAGLQAVKNCGGLAVVQAPDDAECRDMPCSALAHVQVDACIPGAALASTLVDLVGARAGPEVAVPASLAVEQALSTGIGDPMEHLNTIGERSRFSCPECSGVLWEIAGVRPRRYRCHTGHAYTLRSLAQSQDGSTDAALWSAMRALQEREALLRTLADANEPDTGDADELRAEAERNAEHARQMRRIIESE